MTFSRLLKYASIAFAVFAVLILLYINGGLASLADAIYPGSRWWTHGVLLIIEAVALFWLWKSIFGRHPHLLLLSGDSNQDRQELMHRLCSNKYLKEADLALTSNKLDDKEFINKCLEHLHARADEEIEQTAKRIFLATALSQNGRLDALIMFFSLCRMIWRISSIYNQGPHPLEVLRLYRAIATSTFLAFSIEQLNITTEVSAGFANLLNAVAPAIVIGGTPFVGAALQKVTASTFDGAANCFLALRTGIITRNTFAYILTVKDRPSRSDVFKEAGKMLLSISIDPLNTLNNTAKGFVAGAAQAVVTNTEKAIQSVVDSATDTIRAVRDETTQAIEVVKNTAISTVLERSKNAVQLALNSVTETGIKTSEVVKDGVNAAAQTGSTLLNNVSGVVSDTGQAVLGGLGNIIGTAGEMISAPLGMVKQAGKSVGSCTNGINSQMRKDAVDAEVSEVPEE